MTSRKRPPFGLFDEVAGNEVTREYDCDLIFFYFNYQSISRTKQTKR